MPKFHVTATVTYSIDIEAESYQEARDAARYADFDIVSDHDEEWDHNLIDLSVDELQPRFKIGDKNVD
jgi:hypothetical protein